MTLKRITQFAFALLFICGTALAEPPADKSLTVRSFQLKNKTADRAAAAIKELVSGEGSFAIQPSTNSLTVTDRPENLKAIAAALAAFDAPAQAVQLQVMIVAASKTNPAQKVPDELKAVAAKLALFQYNSFEKLGDATFHGREGEPGMIDMGAYRADFRLGEFDPASNTIKVADFKLAKLDNDKLTQLYKTTLNLKPGNQLIVGATKAPESQKALMIVITAKR